jgi:hypothetical protein
MRAPKRTPSVEEMRTHIDQLCLTRDIMIEYCVRPTQAWSAREIETICVAPVKSQISYVTALHEIGHIVGRYQTSRRSMVRERWAWEWARRQALMWTRDMERCKRESLAWARRNARQRGE